MEVCMKFISWNVNGLRAAVKKGFLEFFYEQDVDFFCIQETKLQEGQIDLSEVPYQIYWNSAERKGYSGTAIFTKHQPLTVSYGIDIVEHDNEGRVITLEYKDFYLVNVYTPNSKRDLARLPYRLQWEDDFREYLNNLQQQKPVILCGDLNVAHQEIDLMNPKSNKFNSGFTTEERGKFDELLAAGFLDSYRHLYPEVIETYTWWSYMHNARERNIGWRIDYFCVSEALKDKIEDAIIYPEVLGSDHCPIGLSVKFE